MFAMFESVTTVMRVLVCLCVSKAPKHNILLLYTWKCWEHQ